MIIFSSRQLLTLGIDGAPRVSLATFPAPHLSGDDLSHNGTLFICPHKYTTTFNVLLKSKTHTVCCPNLYIIKGIDTWRACHVIYRWTGHVCIRMPWNTTQQLPVPSLLPLADCAACKSRVGSWFDNQSAAPNHIYPPNLFPTQPKPSTGESNISFLAQETYLVGLVNKRPGRNQFL